MPKKTPKPVKPVSKYREMPHPDIGVLVTCFHAYNVPTLVICTLRPGWFTPRLRIGRELVRQSFASTALRTRFLNDWLEPRYEKLRRRDADNIRCRELARQNNRGILDGFSAVCRAVSLLGGTKPKPPTTNVQPWDI